MARELHGSREIVPHEKNRFFTLYLNRETDDYPEHWHNETEIIMPLENSYSVRVDREQYVLQPQDIIIIPSGISHELTAPPSGRRLIFLVRHEIIRQIHEFDSVYSRFFPCAVFRPEENDSEYLEMVQCLRKIMHEYLQQPLLWDASIHGNVICFFVLAGRIFLRRSDSAPQYHTQRQRSHTETFFSVCTYLTEHCTERITLEETARIAGFSRSQFIRLFKEYSGMSYYEYLTRQRIVRADLLLGEPEYSVTDAALQSGFNSISTFNRVFQQYHHCTPTEYRHRLKDTRQGYVV